MNSPQPETLRGEIRLPNRPGANPHAIMEAALADAQSRVAPGSIVRDPQIAPGSPDPADSSVMVFKYTAQVVPPGGQPAPTTH